MKKCLILCMSCNRPFFREEEKTIMETWASGLDRFPDMRLLIYSAAEDGGCHYDAQAHKILVPAGDDLAHTFEKTVKALEMVDGMEDFRDYDFIVRTNCSTYINLEILNQILDDLDEDTVYDGITHCNLACSAPFNFSPHPMGSLIIMSRKLAGVIMDSQNLDNARRMDRTENQSPDAFGIDDSAIGSILNCHWIGQGEDMLEHYQTLGMVSLQKYINEKIPIPRSSLSYSLRMYEYSEEERMGLEIPFIYSFHRQMVANAANTRDTVDAMMGVRLFTVLLPEKPVICTIDGLRGFYRSKGFLK